MIELQGLSKTFVTKQGSYQALKDIDLTIADGDVHGIIGVSGAGKSTLVRCVNLLERPTAGRVLIDGEDVTAYTGRRLLDLRAKIGMVFQDFSLFAQRTALANVTFPLTLRRDPRPAAGARGMELLELVGLSDKAKSYPSELSGGQQQRVAIARALANHPKYLLCDEATSALDSLTTLSILELLKSINRELGVTILVITHEMKVISDICNKVAVLDGARIVEQGPTDAVFAAPRQEITRRLLGQAAAEAALAAAAQAAQAASANERPVPDGGEAYDALERLGDFLDRYLDLLLQGTLDTLAAVSITTLCAYALGISLAVVLKVTAPGSLRPIPALNATIGWVVNMGRSIPFVILMVLLIPLSRLIVGTSLGVAGSIVPLTLGAAPFVGRIVESSFEEVPPGRVEAALAFGASTWQVIWHVYLRESLPSLVRGAAITLITLIGYQAIMGAFGGGGLGDVAVRFGYHRFKGDVMLAAVVILIAMVQAIQSLADLLARRIDKR